MDTINNQNSNGKEGDNKALSQDLTSEVSGTPVKPISLLSSMGALPKLGDKAALNAFMEQNRGG